MSDPEYDADYVEAFNNAADDEQALEDAERQTTTATGGCFALVLALVIVAVSMILR